MRKNLITAVIIGVTAFSTANAADTNQDVHFITEHEMQDVSGARLAAGFDQIDVIRVLTKTHKMSKLTYADRVKIGKRASEMMRDPNKVYTSRTFQRQLLRYAGQLQRD